MKKDEIIDSIVKNIQYHRDGKDFKYRKDDVQEIVNYVFDMMKMSLRMGDRVVIRGFGTFVVRHKNPKKVVDISSGEPMMTRERDYVAFIQSNTFDVNNLF